MVKVDLVVEEVVEKIGIYFYLEIYKHNFHSWIFSKVVFTLLYIHCKFTIKKSNGFLLYFLTVRTNTKIWHLKNTVEKYSEKYSNVKTIGFNVQRP